MAEGMIEHEVLNTENISLRSEIATGDLKKQRVGYLRIITGSVTVSQREGAQTTVGYVPLASDKPKITIYAPCTSYGISAQCEMTVTVSTGAIQIAFPTGANTNSFKINTVYSVV